MGGRLMSCFAREFDSWTNGFERFDLNGIEQLCVNYVNERLQQYFVEKYLLLSCRNDLQKESLIGEEVSSGIVRSHEA